MLAFKKIVRKKDPRVFDFLKRVNIDFSLDEHLIQLLNIDANQTVEFILSRFKRM